ncbi:MAG: glutamate 5-kinase [Clostridia bacterium]|nr:glutamate 5-kinase [Clostridia bacterium]
MNFEKIKSANLIVVKVGTSTLTHQSGYINIRRVEQLVKCLSDLQNSGKHVVLVSSGAISCGLGKIGLRRKSLTLEQKQAAASVGQCELMDMYNRLFADYGHTVGQLLLTKDVTDDEQRKEHAKNTLRVLIELGCIPVINDNDSVSSEGIKYGGNDILSAVVAMLCEADLVVNLTDIDGFFDADPKTAPDAKLISYVEKITPEVIEKAGGAGTERGTGGMAAKLIAAKQCTDYGIPMVIANGANPDILYDVMSGTFKGTFFDTLEA